MQQDFPQESTPQEADSTTAIIEEKLAGGTTADAPTVENYPGFATINGAELAEKMTAHCRKTGVTIRELETVTALNLQGEKKSVKTTRTEYEAIAVIVATGSHYREIGALGEKEFRGKGVSYCGVCDGPLFKGKNVMVVGGGNSAAITTLYLSGLAADVKLVHRKEMFRCEEAYVKDIQTKHERPNHLERRNKRDKRRQSRRKSLNPRCQDWRNQRNTRKRYFRPSWRSTQ